MVNNYDVTWVLNSLMRNLGNDSELREELDSCWSNGQALMFGRHRRCVKGEHPPITAKNPSTLLYFRTL